MTGFGREFHLEFQLIALPHCGGEKRELFLNIRSTQLGNRGAEGRACSEPSTLTLRQMVSQELLVRDTEESPSPPSMWAGGWGWVWLGWFCLDILGAPLRTLMGQGTLGRAYLPVPTSGQRPV